MEQTRTVRGVQCDWVALLSIEPLGQLLEFLQVVNGHSVVATLTLLALDDARCVIELLGLEGADGAVGTVTVRVF